VKVKYIHNYIIIHQLAFDTNFLRVPLPPKKKNLRKGIDSLNSVVSKSSRVPEDFWIPGPENPSIASTWFILPQINIAPEDGCLAQKCFLLGRLGLFTGDPRWLVSGRVFFIIS